MKTRQTGNLTISLFLIPLLLAAPAFSAGEIPVVLTIDDAVKTAQDKSPMLAMSRFDAEAAAARVKMAGAKRLPSLSATAFFTRGDMPGILTGPQSVMPAASSAFPENRFFDGNLMLMQPLDVSGSLGLGTRAAKLRAAAASYDSESVRQELIMEVRAGYYGALYQDQRAAAFESAVKVAEEQLRNDTSMVEAGKAPAYYLDRDRAELAMNQQELAEARKDAATARIRLAAVMGLDPSTRLELKDTLAAPSAFALDKLAPPASGDCAKSSTTECNVPPELASTRLAADAARTSSKISRRAFAPDVSLTFMSDRISSRMNGNMEGTTAALIVAFPISDGGMRRAAVRETRAMSAAAERELRAAELRVSADFQSARLEFDTAVRNIATAESALKSAEENYRVAKIRYDAGKGILVEILDAVSSLTRARLNKAMAVRDALMARDMALRIAGKLN